MCSCKVVVYYVCVKTCTYRYNYILLYVHEHVCECYVCILYNVIYYVHIIHVYCVCH